MSLNHIPAAAVLAAEALDPLHVIEDRLFRVRI